MLPLFERPLGVIHFGLICGASLLFLHQGVVNELLYRSWHRARYRMQAMLCLSSSAYALANVVGYLPMGAALKVQVLQLQWTFAIWVVISYVHALQAYLGVQREGLRRIVLACRVLIVVPIIGMLMLAATGSTFFYELRPQEVASFVWRATGNVASYSPVTHAFVAMSFLTMCGIIYIITREILGRPKPDRWLVFGVIFTGFAATTEGLIGGLGLNDAVPVFYLANAVEILRITYVSTLEAGSQAARLEQKQAEQRRTIEQQMELLKQSAKWSKVGEMTGHIGHELRNPLSAAHSWLQVAQHRAGDDQPLLRDPLDKARTALEHLDGIVAGLGTISRDSRSDELRAQSLADTLQQARSLCAHRLKQLECDVQLRVPGGLVVRGRPSELVQVFINLISNACDAVEPLDARQIRIEAEARDEGVLVRVSDSGPAPPPRVREHMFQPFYTTKQTGKGTGIGLSICRQIIEGYGGQIGLDADARQTTLRLWLPSAQAPAA